MSTRTQVSLRDKRSGDYVPAILIDGVTKEEVDAAEKIWRPAMETALQRIEAEKDPSSARPQHAHWDWRRKHEATSGLLVYQILGVECGNEMQGLMLLKTAMTFCRIPSEKGKGLVYVAFLETAPWNSPRLIKEPRYGQVGTVLLSAAVQISQDLGFSGRIGLHALPQSEEWYSKRCNMTDLGPDPDPKHQNLKYFEMTAGQASQFLS